MKEDVRFKPLWRIRNSAYRKYAKGCTRKRFARYIQKIKKILAIKY